MATLTTSWKSYASASFSTGPATIAFYLEARYTSQSTANNTTNVQTRLRSAYTKGGSTAGAGYKFTCTYASTVSGSGTWTFENEVITSGSKTVTHKTDGTQTVSLNATAYNKYWGFNKSMSATVSLPTIQRLATVTAGTDFNDETNPKITFTNPAGFNTRPYLNFYNSAGTLVHQILQTIGRYTSPYTWSLTEQQREALRSDCNLQEQYRVQEGIDTYNGSTKLGAHSIAKTFTIINASPTFTVTYEDTNPDTIAITGNNQQIIRNQSTLRINITNAEAKKYATLQSLTIDINGTTYTGTISGTTGTIEVGTLDISENIQAPVRLTDSRGYTTTAPLIIQILNWELPTANITLGRQNNFYSETNITVDANYSSLDGNNTIDIKVRTKKKTESTYGAYTSLSDNVTATLNLDNLYEWDVQVLITDRLGSTTYNLSIGKGMPIIYFDRLNRSVGVDCFPLNQETLEIKNQDVKEYIEDTGWQPLTLVSGVTAGSIGRTPSYRRIGKTVYIDATFAFTKGSSGMNLATIPAEVAPTAQMYVFTNLGGSRIARTYITAAGTIGCDWIYNLNATSQYTGSVAWYQFTTSYLID